MLSVRIDRPPSKVRCIYSIVLFFSFFKVLASYSSFLSRAYWSYFHIFCDRFWYSARIIKAVFIVGDAHPWKPFPRICVRLLTIRLVSDWRNLRRRSSLSYFIVIRLIFVRPSSYYISWVNHPYFMQFVTSDVGRRRVNISSRYCSHKARVISTWSRLRLSCCHQLFFMDNFRSRVAYFIIASDNLRGVFVPFSMVNEFVLELCKMFVEFLCYTFFFSNFNIIKL